MKSLKKLLFLLILGGLIVAAFTYFRDTAAPVAQLTPGEGPISGKTPLVLNLHDEGAGLKNVTIEAVQGKTRQLLLSRDYPPQTLQARINLQLGDKKLAEGALSIEVTSGDRAIYHLGEGNVRTHSFKLTYDSRAPIISILSRTHNFRHGGSGLVRYRLNEQVAKSGLLVGKHFFPGFKQDSGDFIVLAAWPWNMKAGDFVPRVMAQDLAGNERQAGIYYHTIERKFAHTIINLPDSFLQRKAPEFETLAPGLSDPLAIFLKVNGDVRAADRQKMVELSHKTATSPLWKGAFNRQPGAASLSSFADARTYIYRGKKVDHATHLGCDLASVARAKVLAANAGVVVYADYLGIYGQCVVIDHGLGLQTLYAHMSQLDVSVGDQVSRKQPIGRTGSTGMAGGDHLHFGVFIAGVPVQPLEWWDAHWIKNNIASNLQQH